MNKLLLFSFLSLITFSNSFRAQENVKKDLYIFFDASKSGAHKIRRGADSQRPYDIYTFKVIDVRNGKPRKIVLNSVDLFIGLAIQVIALRLGRGS